MNEANEMKVLPARSALKCAVIETEPREIQDTDGTRKVRNFLTDDSIDRVLICLAASGLITGEQCNGLQVGGARWGWLPPDRRIAA